MEIRQFAWNLVDSNSWLIEEGSDGLLIDAIDNPELLREIRKLSTLTIILTHSHFDHIYGLNRIRESVPEAKVISTKLCSENIGNAYKNMSSSATAFMVFYSGKNDVIVNPITCEPAEEEFEDEKRFIWHEHEVELDAFHGHTSDSLIVILDGKCVFSGDSLLPFPTITRFPSGSTAKFWEEDVPKLQGLSSINEDIIVYPGHGSIGRLEDMLVANKRPERYKRQGVAF